MNFLAVISLPKRVAYTEKDSKLQITYYDYVFDPEEEKDALERIKVCFLNVKSYLLYKPKIKCKKYIHMISKKY